MSLPSLLIAHSWIARGGSEATALWTIQALRNHFRITLVTAASLGRSDWDALNHVYGTDVDPTELEIIQAPRLPGANGPRALSNLQGHYFERFCHSIADRYDLCMSAYNPVWFGRPGIQLIGDFSFSEDMRRRLHAHGRPILRHRDSPVRSLYLRLGRRIGVPSPSLADRGDLILANSAWAERMLSEHFGISHTGVLHPPVTIPDVDPASTVRDPLSFVCLGRIEPEKEIERIVRILARVRAIGFPVTLTVAGHFGTTGYGSELQSWLREQGDWISIPGFLDLEGKRQVLSSHTYAIHGCRIEAFGIAVAEMAAMGCVPVVPSSGGAGEVVPFPELQYDSEEEGVEKIVALLQNPARTRELSLMMPTQARRFIPERFIESVQRYVLDFYSTSIHAAAPENIPALH